MSVTNLINNIDQKRQSDSAAFLFFKIGLCKQQGVALDSTTQAD